MKTKTIINQQTRWRLYLASLVISDTVMVYIALRLAFALRFNAALPIFQLEITPSLPFYMNLTLALLPMWLVVFAIGGLYQRQHLLGGTEEYSRLFQAVSINFLLVVFIIFLNPNFVVARGWLISVWVLSFILTFLGRFILRRIIYFLRKRGFFLANTVIVGANPEGMMLARQLAHNPVSGLNVVGYLDKKLGEDTQVGSLRVLGSVDQLDDIVKAYQIEEVILASSAYSSRDNLIEIFKNYGTLKHINVRMSSGLYEIITTGLTVQELAYVPLVRVNQVRLTGLNQLLKTILDLALTIPGLIIISPFLAILAVLIKLDSPGPAIYRRRVMGVNGRQFDAFKFRTMYTNGNEILAQYPELQSELEKNAKLKVDPRVTRIGKFIRKYSLDELPQLFNVLIGDMSLVGPRMISPPEMAYYNTWGINLLTVRPGITGLWQVSGRSDISYEERVRLDMHYIRNWTIWLDLQLLFRTLPAVLAKRGAY